jgi:predicted metal-dependent hydrolase
MDRVRRVTKIHGRRSRGLRRISPDAFKADVRAWAEKLGVPLKEIHVRPMKRKWASCSTSGRISFAEDLLAKPARFRSEVIVHELLHLKVPNHGKLFKVFLRAYLRTEWSSWSSEFGIRIM